MGITEGEKPMADDHAHTGIGAADGPVGRGHGGENVIDRQGIALKLVQLAGEDIQQHLGIRGRVHMPASALEQAFAHRLDIGEVPVIRQRDAMG